MPLNNIHLIDELPEFRTRILELQDRNPEFSRLLNQYHSINREIHRLEDGGAPVSDQHLEDRKKFRLRLKDQLYAMLNHG